MAVAGIASVITYASLYPKRFAPVVDGRLYRSGELTPRQLEHLHAQYGIDRVICLLNPAATVTQREREAAAKLGIAWENVPLKGDGSSTPEDRDRLRQLISKTALEGRRTLVHCAAGANRTGLAIGMYRIHHDGWTVAEVLEEMRTFDFEDLPKHENLRAALEAEAALAIEQAESSAKADAPKNGEPRP